MFYSYDAPFALNFSFPNTCMPFFFVTNADVVIVALLEFFWEFRGG